MICQIIIRFVSMGMRNSPGNFTVYQGWLKEVNKRKTEEIRQNRKHFTHEDKNFNRYNLFTIFQHVIYCCDFSHRMFSAKVHSMYTTLHRLSSLLSELVEIPSWFNPFLESFTNLNNLDCMDFTVPDFIITITLWNIVHSNKIFQKSKIVDEKLYFWTKFDDRTWLYFFY